MNLSALFIDRPVATTLLAVGLALAGTVALILLPVAILPRVDFPTISVQATLPGASPEVMAGTVAAPLERALGRIAGITEMTSANTQSNTRITLQFDLDRDIDGAARDVQSAISAARSQLPSSLPSNPTWRKVNPSESPIMILALTSDALTQGQMYDVAATLLAQRLSQVNGVGQVTPSGSSLPAVRVEIIPTALHARGLSVADVRNAVGTALPVRPKGSVADDDTTWQVGLNDRLARAGDYRPLVVAWRNGAPVRLDDVAEVRDGVEDLRNAGSFNGRPSVQLNIYRQPGANIIETADRVRDLLPTLRAMIPASVDLSVAIERTSTIRASLVEVERALAIATALVILVVYAFLRRARTALIPTIAVPLSLIGTCGAMWLCGYSLNNLSLMALTVSTGFVVDDAIVVLENVSRHIEEGMAPRAAALQGAREVGATVLSMSAALVAVFLPVLLMGGVVGRLFREFAVTLTAAIGLSLLVSLTVTPMLCATLLKPAPPARAARRRAPMDALRDGYRRSLRWTLAHSRFTVLLLGGIVALNVYLYIIVPKGFFPQQDVGRIIGFIQGDQAISFDAMKEKLERFVEIVRADPAVREVVAFTGGGARNSSTMFFSLAPLSEGRPSADDVVARLRKKLGSVAGARLFMQPVQDLRVGGRMGNAAYQYTLLADDLQDLREWMPKLQRALVDAKELTDVNTDQQVGGLQTTLVVDRDAIARLGVTMRSIDAALGGAFGQSPAATIYAPLNQYRVIVEAAPRFTRSPESLEDVRVPTAAGTLVPLSAVAHWEPTSTPLAVNRQGQALAATLSFNLPPGSSLGDGVRIIRETAARIGMPVSIRGGFQGTAQAFQKSLESQPLLILAALVSVYLVLGILYENLVHPLTILSTIPSAGTGALLALLATGTEFSLIALIGVLLLVGIVMKNAILMIDFAIHSQRETGARAEDAILEACMLRVRPILMTTAAALFGALPLAIGFGDGAELRRPLGVAIVGGLLVSQVLTLYTTPVVYLYLDRFRVWCGSWRRPKPMPIASGVSA